MRFLVDTNVLVYAANSESPQNARVRSFLEERFSEGSPWCLTWGVVYEFLRVITHPRVLQRPFKAPDALQFIQSLAGHELVSILTPTSRHWDMLDKTIGELPRPAGSLFHDINTAVLAREHGIPEVITADTDFLQFRFLKVTNPLL